jgi:hypothetical protein
VDTGACWTSASASATNASSSTSNPTPNRSACRPTPPAPYPGVPGARAVIEAQVREWCQQVLIEVVLAARNSTWGQEQLDALLSPTSFRD